MDALSTSKNFHTMNSYKDQFLHSIYLLVAVVLACSLFCFYPYWFPSLYSPTMESMFLPVPDSFFSIFSSKCLFVVANVIVIFLVGEAKFVGSNSSYSASEIYDEYAERTRGISNLDQGKVLQNKPKIMNMVEDKRVMTSLEDEQVKDEVAGTSIEEEEEFHEAEEEGQVVEDENEVEEESEVSAKEDEKVEKGRERDGEMELGGDEELNRRIEEFITRVNRQMWLEEAMLLNSRLSVSCTA